MIVNVAKRENDNKLTIQKEYTEAEIALNAYIREYFPEWNCKEIG